MDDRFIYRAYIIENNKVVLTNMEEIMEKYFPALSELNDIPSKVKWEIMCYLEKCADFQEYKKTNVFYNEKEAEMEAIKILHYKLGSIPKEYDHLTIDELIETIDFLKSKKIIT